MSNVGCEASSSLQLINVCAVNTHFCCDLQTRGEWQTLWTMRMSHMDCKRRAALRSAGSCFVSLLSPVILTLTVLVPAARVRYICSTCESHRGVLFLPGAQWFSFCLWSRCDDLFACNSPGASAISSSSRCSPSVAHKGISNSISSISSSAFHRTPIRTLSITTNNNQIHQQRSQSAISSGHRWWRKGGGRGLMMAAAAAMAAVAQLAKMLS